MLYAGHTHCASCGAKWLENRITMRQVAADFSDMYLGFDTKFVHTYYDLFKKPEAVINGYLNGRRVYYMDAVRYLLLALFITGIYVFVIKQTNVMDEYMKVSGIQDSIAFSNMSPEQIEQQMAFSSAFMDYQGIILLLTIPLLAIAGRITFWGKKHFNFTEHVVFFLYTYGHMVIVTTPISILLIYISPPVFYYWSFIGYLFMFLHTAYCYKRCFQLDTGTIILKSMISIIVMGALIVLTIIIGIILFITFLVIAEKSGYDISNFLPAQPA
ncbi:Protein of unknown function [Nonlabens sp. Hel1_33_55]|uniref:DUF3667 domain-containing protein n=1 Tax=Nonlabens sp. Hel1_33_55 TaxID=1336802 RepID=UPI000875EB84|nr:DUF3667 domain-containing protein [Nonlabens sp. Hel1_33_55]SCX88043.1 Protein of unknown function [Nonlabens sp. Hel1_33_55]